MANIHKHHRLWLFLRSWKILLVDPICQSNCMEKQQVSFQSGKPVCCKWNGTLNHKQLTSGGFIHESQTVESCNLSCIDDGPPLGIGIEAGDLRSGDFKQHSLRKVMSEYSWSLRWMSVSNNSFTENGLREKMTIDHSPNPPANPPIICSITASFSWSYEILSPFRMGLGGGWRNLHKREEKFVFQRF